LPNLRRSLEAPTTATVFIESDYRTAARRKRPTYNATGVRRSVLTLLLLSFITFFLGLGRQAITDSDEAFYAEAAREMVEGNDWLTPHFNYEDRWPETDPVLLGYRRGLCGHRRHRIHGALWSRVIGGRSGTPHVECCETATR
jgi:hypothetical protein